MRNFLFGREKTVVVFIAHRPFEMIGTDYRFDTSQAEPFREPDRTLVPRIDVRLDPFGPRSVAYLSDCGAAGFEGETVAPSGDSEQICQLRVRAARSQRDFDRSEGAGLCSAGCDGPVPPAFARLRGTGGRPAVTRFQSVRRERRVARDVTIDYGIA
jgi:hypothetical protein